MQAFVYRLLAPRSTFALDMSAAERATMMEHGEYWARLMREGRVLAFGPVNDESGSYGLGLVIADDIAEVEALRDADPAITASHGLRAKIAPMFRLVTPGGVYEAS